VEILPPKLVSGFIRPLHILPPWMPSVRCNRAAKER
jgi:hypothetical protein